MSVSGTSPIKRRCRTKADFEEVGSGHCPDRFHIAYEETSGEHRAGGNDAPPKCPYRTLARRSRPRRLYEQRSRNQVTAVTKAGKPSGGYTTEMAWETRERGTRYYTRSYRDEDGRVVREYIGGGALGELAALRDAEERRRRKEADESGRALLEQAEGLAAPVSELCETADVLLQAHLVAAGYARHKGEWRLKRG